MKNLVIYISFASVILGASISTAKGLRAFKGGFQEAGQEETFIAEEGSLKKNQIAILVPSSRLKGVVCSISFPKGKRYIELDCMRNVDAFGMSDEFNRFFTRVACNGKDEGLLIVNRASPANSEMQALSIYGTCKM